MSGSQFAALGHVKHPQASKKLRPMDDSLRNKVMVNQAFGYSNQIASRALDQQVCAVRLWMQQILADGKGPSIRVGERAQGCFLTLPLLIGAQHTSNSDCHNQSRLDSLGAQEPGNKCSRVLGSQSVALRGHCQCCALQPCCCGPLARTCYPGTTPKAMGPLTKQTLKALADLLGCDCTWEKMNSPLVPHCFALKLISERLGHLSSRSATRKEGLSRLLPL